MRCLLVVPITILVMISCVSGLWAGIAFEETHLDITAPVAATQTEVVFPFRVGGDRAVFITSLKSSCDCTVVWSERMTYQPGEQGEIRAIFKHGERVGEQFKTLTVRTDEQGVGPQKLSFKVVIPRVVEVTPVALFWGIGAAKESREIQIAFPDEKNRPVDVRISGERKNTDVALRCLEPGKKYVLTVSPRSTSEGWKEELPIEMDFGEELGIRKQVCYAYVK